MKKHRRICPECGKVVYYGIYCGNDCSDKAYDRWVKAGRPNPLKPKENQ